MYVAVDDVRLLHPRLEGLHTRVHFGNHPSAYASCVNFTLDVPDGQALDYRAAVIGVPLDTVDVRHSDELSRHQRSRDVTGNGVSVKVQAMARAVYGNRCDDRDVSLACHDVVMEEKKEFEEVERAKELEERAREDVSTTKESDEQDAAENQSSEDAEREDI